MGYVCVTAVCLFVTVVEHGIVEAEIVVVSGVVPALYA